MLLKKSKIILDTLISQPSASSIHSYLGIKDLLIPLLEEKNDCQWNYDNVSLLLQQLIDEEYITAEAFTHGEYPLPDFRYIVLTYKGLHYHEIHRNTIKDFLFKSVLVPIVISLITTAIATLIGYIWGKTALNNQLNNTQKTALEIIETTTVTANGCSIKISHISIIS